MDGTLIYSIEVWERVHTKHWALIEVYRPDLNLDVKYFQGSEEIEERMAPHELVDIVDGICEVVGQS